MLKDSAKSTEKYVAGIYMLVSSLYIKDFLCKYKISLILNSFLSLYIFFQVLYALKCFEYWFKMEFFN